MFIPAICTNCGWTGYAVISKDFGIFMGDYECPQCGHPVKRPQRGHAMGEMANLKAAPIKAGGLSP